MIRLSWPVVLASASPRRQELLAKLIEEFTVDPAHVDEDAMTVDDPDITARSLAREKAMAVFERHPECLVIGGDTVVALPSESGWIQLTKPTDVEDAVRILTELGGKTHHVITGMCLRWPKGIVSFAEKSDVTFRPLTETEIRAHIATGEPMDKAGAYGLQGEGRHLVEKISGSVTNVIGLPMEALEQELKKLR